MLVVKITYKNLQFKVSPFADVEGFAKEVTGVVLLIISFIFCVCKKMDALLVPAFVTFFVTKVVVLCI